MGTRTTAASWLLPVLLTATSGIRAQAWAWRLPPLGAAEYRREWSGKVGDPAPTPAAARAAPLAAKDVDRFVQRVPPAPWLCQGELAADQRAVTGPVRDLRDVARAIAFDLGSRGGIKGRFPRVLPFGDLMLAGSWSASGADGVQTLRATVAGKPPAPLAGEGKGLVERLRVFCLQDVDGVLTMERRVDAANGVVAAYRAEFDLVVVEGPKKCRRVVVADRLDFVAVRDNQDADFRQRVGAAIRAGAAFVRAAIDEKKSFLDDRGSGDDRNFGSGRLALALLTLEHAHVPSTDPVLVRGFDELRRRRIEDSYSLATALMALAAHHAPADEAERIRTGGIASVTLRPLDARDRKVAEKWLDALLDNRDPRGDAANMLRFNYTAGPRYDTSLQQYGLLGLWSAHRMGLGVPEGAFAKAARHLLAVQGVPGERLGLRLTTHAQLREVAGSDEPPRVSELRTAARGFAYQEADEPAFGSMTSAGISGLLLARAGMNAQGDADRALQGRIDDALAAAFGWLASEFSVRCNPGWAERADHHWYYWLYCLERSCELASVARVQGRDWYHEGALQLLAQQQPNGSFRAEQASSLLLDTTCFAVLFLAKSTPAVVTGR